MKDALSLALGLALGILLPRAIVRRDLRKLDAVQLSRAWPEASEWAAVVVFGPLCLLVHFIRTRRSAWGALLGLFWLAVCLGIALGQGKLEEGLWGTNP